MQGYCYLTPEFDLCFRTAESIDVLNPSFWNDNEGEFMRVWRFDTENMESMLRMYNSFKDLGLKNEAVRVFNKTLTQYGFSMEGLKEYRDSQTRRGS